MRKKFTLVLMVLLSLSLVACSKADSSQAGKEDSDNPMEITYWYSWTDKIQENNENLVKQFNETVGKEKNIVVKAEYQGSYDELHQKLQAAHVAGEVPAVSVMEIASIKTFADNGVIEPLSPYIEKDNIDMGDFYEGLLGNCKVEDVWYGLPYLRSTPILYLNTTLLEKAGLDPTGPKTWDELAEYSKIVKEKTGAYGLSMHSYDWLLEGFMLEHGSSVLSEDETKTNLNSEEGKKVFQFFKDLKDKDYIRFMAGSDSAKLEADYMNQNTAMWMQSTGDITKILEIAKENNFEVNTCFLPKEVDYGVPTGGCNLVMAREISPEEKEAAWEFIKWMVDTEQSAYASAYTGYVPSRKSAAETDKIKTLYKETPQFKVALDQLELYSTGRPMNPAYAEVKKYLTETMDAIWVNGADIDSTLAEFEIKANELLSK
ncbi:ABC transporter substrate-binding protein [Anaerosphaera multitolerans]|uniref:ABC transporter substrate-binding protein n=1 Tax=Anaerosphaera multitolerans TaxID=2487351 RepID=A0A437S9A8_9FIRM|nr:ABC transporter substrate-binding protein [Anaerosphaera multitolerans]RVU55706.1 ABC transporter substrate-binding protein [Anaerosphaera multitolerans]